MRWKHGGYYAKAVSLDASCWINISRPRKGSGLFCRWASFLRSRQGHVCNTRLELESQLRLIEGSKRFKAFACFSLNLNLSLTSCMAS